MSGLAVRHIRDPPHPLPFHIAFPLVSQTSTLLSSHLPYPSFSSHVISFLASFAAFCPTQSQLHRKERAVGVGSRWFFLPYLLKPGKEPLSWDTLGMMQGLGASRAPPPPPVDMGLGRRHSIRLPAAVGLAAEVVLHRPHSADALGNHQCLPCPSSIPGYCS